MTHGAVSVAAKTIALGYRQRLRSPSRSVRTRLGSSRQQIHQSRQRKRRRDHTLDKRSGGAGRGSAKRKTQVQLIPRPGPNIAREGLMEKSSEIRTKEVCFTASDGHLISGQKLVIALLIEPEGATQTYYALRCP